MTYRNEYLCCKGLVGPFLALCLATASACREELPRTAPETHVSQDVHRVTRPQVSSMSAREVRELIVALDASLKYQPNGCAAYPLGIIMDLYDLNPRWPSIVREEGFSCPHALLFVQNLAL